MKITVNRAAKNSARCQRSRAIQNLITEHDGEVVTYSCLKIASSVNFKQQIQPSCSVIKFTLICKILFHKTSTNTYISKRFLLQTFKYLH